MRGLGPGAQPRPQSHSVFLCLSFSCYLFVSPSPLPRPRSHLTSPKEYYKTLLVPISPCHPPPAICTLPLPHTSISTAAANHPRCPSPSRDSSPSPFISHVASLPPLVLSRLTSRPRTSCLFLLFLIRSESWTKPTVPLRKTIRGRGMRVWGSR